MTALAEMLSARDRQALAGRRRELEDAVRTDRLMREIPAPAPLIPPPVTRLAQRNRRTPET